MRVLITGGAGFIGSNLAKGLLKDSDVEHVIVLDNLITGFESNLTEIQGHQKFEFVKGDIRDYNLVNNLVGQCTHISHQAALGSVPRSVKDPILSNDININGTLNVFHAAKENGIEKVVFASSSSVYGDDPTLPKQENLTGNVLSPYALTKKTKEEYARLFSMHYKLSIIGLRYFNVFGPFQNPKGPYAAVIPIFIDHLLKNKAPEIHGDGLQSRDFTYIDNVVAANILALKDTSIQSQFEIFNIALGEKTSLVELYQKIADIIGSNIPPRFGPPREGDIKHSLANIDKIMNVLGYRPLVTIDEGLKRTVDWIKMNHEK